MKRMGLAGIALVVGGLTIVGGASAKTFAQTFKFANQEQTFTVPRGVFVLHVVAVGARGGGGAYGARVSGDLSVGPGETLYVEVGGEGTGNVEAFDGGGVASGCGHCTAGDGGGGASDVRTAPMSAGLSPDDRLIVAGGAGGGAGGSPGEAGKNGFEYDYERCFEEKEEAERRGEEWNFAEHEAACRIEGINEGGGPGTASGGGKGGGTTLICLPCFPRSQSIPGGEGSLGHGGWSSSGSVGETGGRAGGAGGGGYYGGGGGAAGVGRPHEPPDPYSEPMFWTGSGAGGGGGSSLVPPGGREEGTGYPSEVQISWSHGRGHHRPR